MRKSKLWDFLKPALILAAVTACCGLVLSGVNALTASHIARRNAEAANAARRLVIDASQFDEKTAKVDGETVIYHEAKAADGTLVGYVFTATVSGKSGGLCVMTGIAADGTVTGVTVTDDDETANYVEKVEKGGLFAAFKGKPAQKFTLGKDIDAVSQATKTSKGVVDGVNRAVRYFTQLKGGAADE